MTPKARETFLELLCEGWSITHSAKAAGFSRQRFYEERDRDKTFVASAVRDENGSDEQE